MYVLQDTPSVVARVLEQEEEAKDTLLRERAGEYERAMEELHALEMMNAKLDDVRMRGGRGVLEASHAVDRWWGGEGSGILVGGPAGRRACGPDASQPFY